MDFFFSSFSPVGNFSLLFSQSCLGKSAKLRQRPTASPTSEKRPRWAEMGADGLARSGDPWQHRGPLAELAGTPAEAVTPGQHQGPPTGAMGTPEQHHGPLEEVEGTPSRAGTPGQHWGPQTGAMGAPSSIRNPRQAQRGPLSTIRDP